ncbi:MAG: RluA family pseudouridine synthase [Intrasporangium sp.]|uniref:RluA family pseudouridine synthase n=1 Tax=Intrasporangium sp. TaxID=1925024 RepID=UPI003F80DD79
MPDVRTVFVPEGLEGERVDAAVSRLFGLSRTRAADLAGDGHVVVDGKPVLKSERLTAGSMLEVALPTEDAGPRVSPRAEPVPGMRIVHDDHDIVVVDKPAGVAAHPSVGWDGPDVVGGLAAAGFRISTSGAPERQGIVSRLDVGTSGLMVVAKSEIAYSRLKQAFRSRSVDKTYHTLVQGLPDPVVGTIEAPIGRHPGYDYKFAVMKSGKPSVTHYEVIEAFRHASLLEIHLETGRTHQIRVHLAALKHPCVADPLYGADPKLAARVGLDRQWLHAVGLGFEHPTSGDYVHFESAYPAELQHALDVVATF